VERRKARLLKQSEKRENGCGYSRKNTNFNPPRRDTFFPLEPLFDLAPFYSDVT
jgi:hypothetical protein